MVTGIVATAVVVLALLVVVAFVRDQGPPPADVAVAYEEAWDRLDFEALWDLSGAELHDSLGRKEYIAAKRVAYAREQRQLRGLARSMTVEEVAVGQGHARVRTHVELREGDAARNEVLLAQRGGRWVVVSYRLQPDLPALGS